MKLRPTMKAKFKIGQRVRLSCNIEYPFMLAGHCGIVHKVIERYQDGRFLNLYYQIDWEDKSGVKPGSFAQQDLEDATLFNHVFESVWDQGAE
jgi:hypothetical protein